MVLCDLSLSLQPPTTSMLTLLSRSSDSYWDFSSPDSPPRYGGCGRAPVGATCLYQALQRNTSLETLDISSNAVGGVSTMDELKRFLMINQVKFTLLLWRSNLHAHIPFATVVSALYRTMPVHPYAFCRCRFGAPSRDPCLQHTHTSSGIFSTFPMTSPDYRVAVPLEDLDGRQRLHHPR